MKQDTREMAIACGADEGFAMPLAVMLFSAVVNLNRQYDAVDVFVVNGGFQSETREKIENVVRTGNKGARVHWMTPRVENAEALPVKGWITSAAYLRLYLPELIPETVSRVLYLDSDMLIQDDLGQLWEEHQGDANPVAAAQDYKIPFVSSESGLKNFRDLPLPPEHPYFNSGLLLMNLKMWRDERLAQRVMEYTASHAEYIQWADQDGLNAVLAKRWSVISPRWNISSHFYYNEVTPDNATYDYLVSNRQALLDRPGIIHYTGPDKPWSYRTNHPAEQRWISTLRRSGWFSDSAFRLWQLDHNSKKRAYSFYKKRIAPLRYGS
jgi:lipopolysaccharide biosynthesis glycosyltransferase